MSQFQFQVLFSGGMIIMTLQVLSGCRPLCRLGPLFVIFRWLSLRCCRCAAVAVLLSLCCCRCAAVAVAAVRVRSEILDSVRRRTTAKAFAQDVFID